MEIRLHIPFTDGPPNGHLSKALRRSLLSLAVLPAVLAVACDAQTTKVSPPEGFTRATENYRWSIRIVTSRINSRDFGIARLYTNEEPTLSIEGGASLLTAKSVYCESFGYVAGNQAGCTAEFMGKFSVASRDIVTVTDNPVRVFYTQCGGILDGKQIPPGHTVRVEEVTNEELGWTQYGIRDLGREPNKCGNSSQKR